MMGDSEQTTSSRICAETSCNDPLNDLSRPSEDTCVAMSEPTGDQGLQGDQDERGEEGAQVEAEKLDSVQAASENLSTGQPTMETLPSTDTTIAESKPCETREQPNADTSHQSVEERLNSENKEPNSPDSESALKIGDVSSLAPVATSPVVECFPKLKRESDTSETLEEPMTKKMRPEESCAVKKSDENNTELTPVIKSEMSKSAKQPSSSLIVRDAMEKLFSPGEGKVTISPVRVKDTCNGPMLPSSLGSVTITKLSTGTSQCVDSKDLKSLLSCRPKDHFRSEEMFKTGSPSRKSPHSYSVEMAQKKQHKKSRRRSTDKDKSIRCCKCKEIYSTKEARRLHTCNSILDQRFLTDSGDRLKSNSSSENLKSLSPGFSGSNSNSLSSSPNSSTSRNSSRSTSPVTPTSCERRGLDSRPIQCKLIKDAEKDKLMIEGRPKLTVSKVNPAKVVSLGSEDTAKLSIPKIKLSANLATSDAAVASSQTSALSKTQCKLKIKLGSADMSKVAMKTNTIPSPNASKEKDHLGFGFAFVGKPTYSPSRIEPSATTMPQKESPRDASNKDSPASQADSGVFSIASSSSPSKADGGTASTSPDSPNRDTITFPDHSSLGKDINNWKSGGLGKCESSTMKRLTSNVHFGSTHIVTSINCNSAQNPNASLISHTVSGSGNNCHVSGGSQSHFSSFLPNHNDCDIMKGREGKNPDSDSFTQAKARDLCQPVIGTSDSQTDRILNPSVPQASYNRNPQAFFGFNGEPQAKKKRGRPRKNPMKDGNGVPKRQYRKKKVLNAAVVNKDNSVYNFEEDDPPKRDLQHIRPRKTQQSKVGGMERPACSKNQLNYFHNMQGNNGHGRDSIEDTPQYFSGSQLQSSSLPQQQLQQHQRTHLQQEKQQQQQHQLMQQRQAPAQIRSQQQNHQLSQQNQHRHLHEQPKTLQHQFQQQQVVASEAGNCSYSSEVLMNKQRIGIKIKINKKQGDGEGNRRPEQFEDGPQGYQNQTNPVRRQESNVKTSLSEGNAQCSSSQIQQGMSRQPDQSKVVISNQPQMNSPRLQQLQKSQSFSNHPPAPTTKEGVSTSNSFDTRLTTSSMTGMRPNFNSAMMSNSVGQMRQQAMSGNIADGAGNNLGYYGANNGLMTGRYRMPNMYNHNNVMTTRNSYYHDQFNTSQTHHAMNMSYMSVGMQQQRFASFYQSGQMQYMQQNMSSFSQMYHGNTGNMYHQNMMGSGMSQHDPSLMFQQQQSMMFKNPRMAGDASQSLPPQLRYNFAGNQQSASGMTNTAMQKPLPGVGMPQISPNFNSPMTSRYPTPMMSPHSPASSLPPTPSSFQGPGTPQNATPMQCVPQNTVQPPFTSPVSTSTSPAGQKQPQPSPGLIGAQAQNEALLTTGGAFGSNSPKKERFVSPNSDWHQPIATPTHQVPIKEDIDPPQMDVPCSSFDNDQKEEDAMGEPIVPDMKKPPSPEPPKFEARWAELDKSLIRKILSFGVTLEGAVPFLVRASRVQKSWYEVTQDLALWTHLDLSSGKLKERYRNDKKLESFLKKYPNIKEVKLTGWKNSVSSSTLKVLATCCPNLVSLGLASCFKLSNEDLKFISDNFNKLERLDLSNVSTSSCSSRSAVSSTSLSEFITTLGKRLTHLNISNNKMAGLPFVFKALSSHASNLEELDISNITTTSRDTILINVEKFQKGCQNLRVLNANHTMISLSETPIKEQVHAPGFPKLRELHTAVDSRGYFEGLDDSQIERLLKSSTNLRLIDIRGCQHVTESCLIRLPTWHMEKLVLAGSSVTSNSSDSLELLVRKWANHLTEMDVSMTSNERAVNMAIDAFAEADDAKIRKLNLCNTCLSLKSLRRLLKNCSTVEYLNLTSCRGLPKGAKRLYSNRAAIEQLLKDINEGKFDADEKD